MTSDVIATGTEPCQTHREMRASIMTLQFGPPGVHVAAIQHSACPTRAFEEVLTALRRGLDGVGMRVLNEIRKLC